MCKILSPEKTECLLLNFWMIKSTKTPILPNCFFWYNCKFHHSKIEITQLAYFHFLIDFSMQKLPFFKASYHVTFQCGHYSIFKNFYCPWKHEKMASKVAYLWQFWFFFSLSAALTSQNGPRLEIHIRNVSQGTSFL